MSDSTTSSIDVDAVRADTPGCVGTDVVHLNSCGSSLPPAPVLDATVST